MILIDSIKNYIPFNEQEKNDKEVIITIKSDENSAVKWIPVNMVNQFSTETHMKIIYAKIISKIK